MRSYLLLSLLALAGCRRESSAAQRPPEAPASAAASASVAPVSKSQPLAMQPPGGSARVDKQIEQLQASLVRLPDKLDHWILLGRAWIQKARETTDPGFYANAGACAARALEIDPRSALGRGLKAQVALNEHRFDDARELAQQALDEAPEDLVALGALGDALLELGRFEEAAAVSQKMMDLKPSLPAFARASYFRWLQGDIEGAKAAALKAARSGRSASDPEPYTWILVQSAMLFWHLGDYDGAEVGFDKALESLSDFPPALVGKGRVAMARGKGKEAAALLERAYKLSPLVETAWLLGDAHAMAGDEGKAREAHELVVSRGKIADPRTLALFLATRNRDLDEALKLARHERQQRGDIYTEDALGWVLFRMGKLDEARAHLERATRLGTRDASLLFHLGALRLAQGDRAAGEKLLRDALKMNPKFDRTGAEEAARLLQGKAKP